MGNLMRLLCDTSIYGEMIKEPEVDKIPEIIKNADKFKIYGFDLIRKELRGNSKVRSRLTGLYSQLTNGIDYPENKKTEELADEYYSRFRKSGGTSPKQKIINDFKIIACASIYDIDVVVSEDAKTMLGPLSKKAYGIVNAANRLRTPVFWKYPRFKEEILKL